MIRTLTSSLKWCENYYVDQLMDRLLKTWPFWSLTALSMNRKTDSSAASPSFAVTGFDHFSQIVMKGGCESMQNLLPWVGMWQMFTQCSVSFNSTATVVASKEVYFLKLRLCPVVASLFAASHAAKCEHQKWPLFSQRGDKPIAHASSF